MKRNRVCKGYKDLKILFTSSLLVLSACAPKGEKANTEQGEPNDVKPVVQKTTPQTSTPSFVLSSNLKVHGEKANDMGLYLL